MTIFVYVQVIYINAYSPRLKEMSGITFPHKDYTPTSAILLKLIHAKIFKAKDKLL
jgi:hypothetical protein